MSRSSSTSSSSLPASLVAFGAMVLTFALVNVGLAVSAHYWDSNHMLMEDINSEKWSDGADILLLGDSRSHQGLVPTVIDEALATQGIEATTLNLARPGQQAPFFYYLSKRVADESIKPPKAVVLNISFYLLGTNSWLRDVYFSYYRPSVEEARHTCEMGLQTCWKAAEWFLRTRFPAWTFRARANSWVNAFLKDPVKMTTQIAGIVDQGRKSAFEDTRGYLTRGDAHITDADIRPGIYKIGVEKGFEVYLEYLDLMVQEMSDRGIEIFVYEFPWPSARETEDGFEDILAYYQTLLHDRLGDKVHFLPTVRYWPNELFVDAQHVNHPGAVKLSNELAIELASLPDFRNLF